MQQLKAGLFHYQIAATENTLKLNFMNYEKKLFKFKINTINF